MLNRLQQARRKVQARTSPYKAILGDDNNNPYADTGYYWVRPYGQTDVNGNATPGSAYRVRAGSALIVPRGGRVVWVGYGFDRRLTVLGYDHDDLISAGIDPRAAQPNDPYRQWIRLKDIQNFRALPLAAGGTDSLKVQVRQLFYYTATGDMVRYNGTNESTHIDLTAYVPADGYQRYAVLWLRTVDPNNLGDIQVTYSDVISSIDSTLSFSDLQLCADRADADTIPIQAFRLADAQTTLTLDDSVDVDLRQFINAPQVYGFPNTVERAYRVQAQHSVMMPEVVIIASGGGVEIQTDGLLLIDTPCDCSGTTSSSGTAGDTLPVVDTTAIVKGSSDATKQLRFEVDGFTAGATRVMTPPNYDGTLATLAGAETLTSKTLTSPEINEILDSNGNEEIKFTATASAVNELTVANAATGNAPTISTTGGDTNIGLSITPKGTGTVSIDGAVTINDSGADRDVRIEGDTNANLFFTDASNDNIGIGTNAPDSKALLDVSSTTKGARPAPTMTAAQWAAIASPPDALMAYVDDFFHRRYEYVYNQVQYPVGNLYNIADCRLNAGSSAFADATDATAIKVWSVTSGVVACYRNHDAWKPYQLVQSTTYAYCTDISIANSKTPTGNTTSGSATISGVSSTDGVFKGMTISGTGIPGGTTITGASGTTITISANATATNTGVTLTCTLAANTNWDVSIDFDDASGTWKYYLEKWTSDTARSATSLEYRDGLLVSLSNYYRFIGVIRTDASSKFQDNTSKRFIWNYYNQVPRALTVVDTTNTWAYTSTTIRQANGNAANQVEMVTGIDKMSFLHLKLLGYGNTSGSAIGIGRDTTTAFSTTQIGMFDGGTALAPAFLDEPVALGYHYYAWNEKGIAGNTFVGDNNLTYFQTGMMGSVFA